MKSPAKTASESEALHRLTDDPAVRAYVSSLKREHGNYALSAAETRKIVDASMGTATLAEALYKMRDEGV